ncbi:MAG: homocysteine S-methyltransferase family protein [Oscillospiraceae bacterium]|jgi:5-methyltetrahydrofolate--homocysteine methyltransferase|nr:homocysteine S-methyltransferase family protein [Oscillospiraceae bacterium]
MHILDGAFGTLLLQKNVLAPGENTLFANAKAPETVAEIHRDYIAAGSDIICANTFGGSHELLLGLRAGDTSTAEQLIAGGIAIAKKTAGAAAVALDVTTTGDFLEPHGEMTEQEAAAVYRKLASYSDQCDFVVLETYFDARELEIALAAFADVEKPVIVSMTFDENGRTFAGSSVKEFAEIIARHSYIAAAGINCSLPPKQITSAALEFARLAAKPIVLVLNAGMPNSGITAPDEYAGDLYKLTAEILASGKAIFGVGGCCGTTPAHIAAVKNLFTTKGIAE